MNLKILILSCICFLSFEAASQTVHLSRLQRASGAGYIPYTNANGKQTYQLLDTLVSGDIGSGTTDRVAVWEGDTLRSGVIYDTGAKVGINTTALGTNLLTIKAETFQSGFNLDTSFVAFQDSNSNNIVRIGDSGRMYFGNNPLTSGAPFIYALDNSSGFYNSTGRGIGFFSTISSTNGRSGFDFSNDGSITQIGGVGSLMRLNYNYAPTLGTNAFSSVLIIPTINQTGSADGITRGVYVQPTLTSASSWRSFETNVASGYGFYSAGAADNVFAGKVKVGLAAPPLRTLDTQGTLRISADVDSATQSLIWAGNTQGDLNRLIVGEGLTVSGDSLIGGGTDYTAGTNILIAGDSISADIKWPHWDGGSGWLLSPTYSLTTSFDTVDIGGGVAINMHIGNGITYYDTLTQFGSDYPGFVFDENGTYEMTWGGNYSVTGHGVGRLVDWNWHINQLPIDAFNDRHIRRWVAEVSTRSMGSSTIQFVASANQYLQLVAKSSSASLTDITLRGLHIQIKKIRD